MRKLVTLLSAIMVVIAAVILGWSIKNKRMQKEPSIVSASANASVLSQSQTKVTALPSPATTLRSVSDSKPPLLQINVTDTAILERKWNDWMSARGCNPVEAAQDVGEPISTLRQQALNNNLTAASELGMHLIFDPEMDGRAEAKQVLWQAAIQGSTCALMNYYLIWQRFSLAKRSINHGLNNKPYVHYSLNIPATDAAKRRAILNAYAWDLVWEMRTGVSDIPEYSSTLESQYHYGFRWTSDDHAQACEKATDLYNQLQSAREAAGYGSFDNSPPPVILGGAIPEVGSGCTNWPVPKPQCQKAELHAIDRSGVIHAFEAWVCSANQTNSPGDNE